MSRAAAPSSRSGGWWKLRESEKGVILVVDDEPALRELIQIFLGRNLGGAFRVVEAEHGGIAVDLFRELVDEGCSVPAVVMDVRMPVMDGIEATRRILAIRPGAAVFIVTAYAEENLIQEALAAGAQAVINKALGFPEIALRVSQAVRQGPQVAEAPAPAGGAIPPA